MPCSESYSLEVLILVFRSSGSITIIQKDVCKSLFLGMLVFSNETEPKGWMDGWMDGGWTDRKTDRQIGLL